MTNQKYIEDYIASLLPIAATSLAMEVVSKYPKEAGMEEIQNAIDSLKKEGKLKELEYTREDTKEFRIKSFYVPGDWEFVTVPGFQPETPK